MEAINAAHVRLLHAEEFAGAAVAHAAYVQVAADPAVLIAAAPLVQERVQTLGEALDMLAVPARRRPGRSTRRPPRAAGPDGQAVLAAAEPALAALTEWTTPDDRERVAGGAGRSGHRARAQAAQRVRAGTSRGYRPYRVAAAVRVAGIARPRPLAGPFAVGVGARPSGAVIRAVFFDVDQTLVDFDAAALRAHAALFGDGDGYPLWCELTPQFWPLFTDGELSFDEMRAARMARYLELSGSACRDGALMENRRWALVEESFQVFDDVQPCLDALRSRGLAWA